jgi:hypothetical protein
MEIEEKKSFDPQDEIPVENKEGFVQRVLRVHRRKQLALKCFEQIKNENKDETGRF